MSRYDDQLQPYTHARGTQTHLFPKHETGQPPGSAERQPRRLFSLLSSLQIPPPRALLGRSPGLGAAGVELGLWHLTQAGRRVVLAPGFHQRQAEAAAAPAPQERHQLGPERGAGGELPRERPVQRVQLRGSFQRVLEDEGAAALAEEDVQRIRVGGARQREGGGGRRDPAERGGPS